VGEGNAQVAQLVEHATENRSVGGSIPPLGTIQMADITSKNSTPLLRPFRTHSSLQPHCNLVARFRAS
jgi:hypothetical protein